MFREATSSEERSASQERPKQDEVQRMIEQQRLAVQKQIQHRKQLLEKQALEESGKAQVPVPLPHCPPNLKAPIDVVTNHIIKQGPMLENTLKEKHQHDPKFTFLFPGGLGYEYYQYCLKQKGKWPSAPTTTATPPAPVTEAPPPVRPKPTGQKRRSRFDQLPAKKRAIEVDDHKPSLFTEADSPVRSRTSTIISQPTSGGGYRKPVFTEDSDDEDDGAELVPRATTNFTFSERQRKPSRFLPPTHNRPVTTHHQNINDNSSNNNSTNNDSELTDAELAALGLPTLSSLKSQMTILKDTKARSPVMEPVMHRPKPKPQSSVDIMNQYLSKLDKSEQREHIPVPVDATEEYFSNQTRLRKGGGRSRSLGGENKGYNLLSKMGWKGSGLGKSEQGIVNPVSENHKKAYSDNKKTGKRYYRQQKGFKV